MSASKWGCSGTRPGCSLVDLVGVRLWCGAQECWPSSGAAGTGCNHVWRRRLRWLKVTQQACLAARRVWTELVNELMASRAMAGCQCPVHASLSLRHTHQAARIHSNTMKIRCAGGRSSDRQAGGQVTAPGSSKPQSTEWGSGNVTTVQCRSHLIPGACRSCSPISDMWKSRPTLPGVLGSPLAP